MSTSHWTLCIEVKCDSENSSDTSHCSKWEHGFTWCLTLCVSPLSDRLCSSNIHYCKGLLLFDRGGTLWLRCLVLEKGKRPYVMKWMVWWYQLATEPVVKHRTARLRRRRLPVLDTQIALRGARPPPPAASTQSRSLRGNKWDSRLIFMSKRMFIVLIADMYTHVCDYIY